jgi:hypothetical protein
MENDPADIQGDGEGDEARPQNDEEDYGFGAARDAHDPVVYAKADATALRVVEGIRPKDGRTPAAQA